MKLGVISSSWQGAAITSADLREPPLGLWKVATEILHSLSHGSCISILEDCWTQLFREPYIFSPTGHQSSGGMKGEATAQDGVWWFKVISCSLWKRASSSQLGVGIFFQPSLLDLGNCCVPDNLCAWKILVKQTFKSHLGRSPFARVRWGSGSFGDGSFRCSIHLRL